MFNNPCSPLHSAVPAQISPAQPADRKQSKCSWRKDLNTSWQHSCWPWTYPGLRKGAIRHIWMHTHKDVHTVQIDRHQCILSLTNRQRVKTVSSSWHGLPVLWIPARETDDEEVQYVEKRQNGIVRQPVTRNKKIKQWKKKKKGFRKM